MDLPTAAIPAWEAYKAMEQTKHRHLSYLRELAERYRDRGSRTLSEGVYLEKLLKQHDQQVAAFREEMAGLMRSDMTAHTRLIDYIKKFNETLGTDERPH